MFIQGYDQNIKESRMHAMQKQLFQNMKLYCRSTIVVVNDKRQAKLTALDLSTLIASDASQRKFIKLPEEQLKIFQKNISDRALAQVVEQGVGFIYEGMY